MRCASEVCGTQVVGIDMRKGSECRNEQAWSAVAERKMAFKE